MLNSGSIRLSNLRYLVVGTLILILLVVLPLTAAAGHQNSSSLSGDASYDPAAGGFPQLAGVLASNSGDDIYDPAAALAEVDSRPVGFAASLSGDAAYDPAAGGLAAVSTFPLAASLSDVSGCYADELASSGGFSGDDAYDPAAGGSPDGEILGFACLLDTIGLE